MSLKHVLITINRRLQGISDADAAPVYIPPASVLPHHARAPGAVGAPQLGPVADVEPGYLGPGLGGLPPRPANAPSLEAIIGQGAELGEVEELGQVEELDDGAA